MCRLVNKAGAPVFWLRGGWGGGGVFAAVLVRYWPPWEHCKQYSGNLTLWKRYNVGGMHVTAIVIMLTIKTGISGL